MQEIIYSRNPSSTLPLQNSLKGTMDDTEQSRLEDLILNHRVHIIKDIYRPLDIVDYLYQERHLNEEDVSEIKCDAKNWSRKRKMGALLDIIKFKGPNAINCFLNRLGWEWPQLYETITGKKPPKPPDYFSENRDSRVLDQVLTPSKPPTTPLQPSDSNTVVKHLKKEIEELEKENEKVTNEKKQVDLAFKAQLIKNTNLQEDLNKSLQDYVICSKERDEYKQKWEECALDRVPRKVSERRPDIPPKPVLPVGPVRRQQPCHPSVEATLGILKLQLQEERQHCEELSQLLNEAKTESDSLTLELRKKENKLDKLKGFTKEKDRQIEMITTSKDSYMDVIRQKDDELAKINKEKSDLFIKKHELEKERDQLKNELEELATKRDSYVNI